MPRRKRFLQSSTPLVGGLTPAGHWILNEIRGTSLSLPAIASYCGISYARFSSIISGKLNPPYDFVSTLVDVFSCPDKRCEISKLVFSFKTPRSVSASNRPKREPCSYFVPRKRVR